MSEALGADGWQFQCARSSRAVCASSFCCEGCVVQELLPPVPSWELSSTGRSACARWRAAGSRPAACVWLSWLCCANRPGRSEGGPRTSSPASPAWCSTWSGCEGPEAGEHGVWSGVTLRIKNTNFVGITCYYILIHNKLRIYIFNWTRMNLYVANR